VLTGVHLHGSAERPDLSKPFIRRLKRPGIERSGKLSIGITGIPTC
jgi:hypothetical protein